MYVSSIGSYVIINTVLQRIFAHLLSYKKDLKLSKHIISSLSDKYYYMIF